MPISLCFVLSPRGFRPRPRHYCGNYLIYRGLLFGFELKTAVRSPFLALSSPRQVFVAGSPPGMFRNFRAAERFQRLLRFLLSADLRNKSCAAHDFRYATFSSTGDESTFGILKRVFKLRGKK